MRLIIDTNELRSERLGRYLASSTSNFALLTDYSAMEAYKGDTLATIYRSMDVLSSYPKQVVVLRNTRFVCGLNGRGGGLQKRLIDHGQTKEFGMYVRGLAAARNGDKHYQQQLLAHGTEATAHMERMLKDAETLGDVFEDIAKQHSKAERAAFRGGDSFPSGMVEKSVESVLQIAANLFRDHPEVKRWPPYDELVNTFIFRSSLCMYLLALDWAARGGVRDAAAPKLRNDMVDMNFATYGTFFDGLMSSDAKTIRIHREARIWLSALFDVKIAGGFG